MAIQTEAKKGRAPAKKGMMWAAQVAKANGPLELVEKPIPEPPAGWVRIQIKACGICHSDSFTVEGVFPGIQYPRVPGHEIAGVIDKLGEGVQGWKKGQRVGVGWCGGNCGYCESCLRGDFITCERIQVPGINYDGGYEEYMIAPAKVLAHIPDELSFTDAAPLMCAGITTYNALRHAGALPGDTVVILGVGGLGHLAIQFAAKMGYKVVAIARGKDKEALAKKLGAHLYLEENENPTKTLQEMGGAKVILSTITQTEPVNELIEGLSVDGNLVLVGIGPEPVEILPLALIGKRRRVTGWPCGSAIHSQDTLQFSNLTGVRSMNEILPLEQASVGYARMMSGRARFRLVLSMD